MEIPPVRYADRAGRALAYQSWGVGSAGYLVISEWPANADSVWEHPTHLRLWRLVGSLGRVVRFDRSGIGSSDPDLGGLADPEVWAEDAVAVLDTAGLDRVTVLTEGWGCHAAVALAARHGDRVERLLLLNGYLHLREDSSSGLFEERLAAVAGYVRSGWGSGAVIAGGASFGDDYPEWCGRYERGSASPTAAATFVIAAFRSDVTSLVDRVRCPTRVNFTGDLSYVPEAASRQLAENIQGADFVSDAPSYYDLSAEAGQEAAAFLSGGQEISWGERRLAVVVFTDIVGSTERLVEGGDHNWSGVLEDYQTVVDHEVGRFGGSVVKQTGDGHLLTFTSPGSAISALFAIRRTTRSFGFELRFGVHMGEVECLAGGDIAGVTVHAASRIADTAGPGQILVSSVVADLLSGTGLELIDTGSSVLKGIPREWRLFTVSPSTPATK